MIFQNAQPSQAVSVEQVGLVATVMHRGFVKITKTAAGKVTTGLAKPGFTAPPLVFPPKEGVYVFFLMTEDGTEMLNFKHEW